MSTPQTAAPSGRGPFFDTSNLKGDLFGGLTAGIVALPLALAFGEASGAGPIAGLWGAIFVGFFAAIFGGTGSQVSVAEALDSTVNLYVYDENTTPESIGVDIKVKILSDIDGDGNVTLKDISAFMAAWHTKEKIYDFNGDGRMTFRDFSIILANFFF